MEELLIALLKLLVQLVLFAVTGKWHDLQKLGERARQVRQQKPATPRQPRPARTARPARGRPAGAPPGETPWPFEFEAEYVETEPQDEYVEFERQEEAVGGERARQPTFQRRRARRIPKPPPATRGPRSIASALRDWQTVREAIVLGAALGRRGPRR